MNSRVRVKYCTGRSIKYTVLTILKLSVHCPSGIRWCEEIIRFSTRGVTAMATPTDAERLRTAVTHHRAGHLQEAERMYRSLLGHAPTFAADVHTNLVMLLTSVDRLGEASEAWWTGWMHFPGNAR